MRFLFLAILFLSLNTVAAEANLKAYSKSLLILLSEANIHQVGDLKVSSLIKELDQVRWEIKKSAVLHGSGKPRFDCNYFVVNRAVSCNMVAASEATLPLVTLHEGLGALGYIDEEYEISSAIAIHALTRTSQAIDGVTNHLVSPKKRYSDEVYVLAGKGGTSVGGGGDSVGVTIKTFAVATLYNLSRDPSLNGEQKGRTLNAIKNLMLASIENNTDASQNAVIFEPIDGKVVVRIPRVSWQAIHMNSNSHHFTTLIQKLFSPIFDYFL